MSDGTGINKNELYKVTIIGAGLGGLSAAIRLAEAKIAVNLVSLQQSERAQSVLAEGGINGALDTMGEGDTVGEHCEETMKGGVWLADPVAVEGLTARAPAIIRWLQALGVPFNSENGELVQRNFGGQKKKRTAYAQSSTGKMIMSALIDEARKYECKGLIRRFAHHEFVRLLLAPGAGQQGPGPEEAPHPLCRGVRVRDRYTGDLLDMWGTVILASGGMNGMFPEMTTGTVANRGMVTAKVFAQGVCLSNLEMLQYHPTTIGISGKRCLISEAARGEGGRLFILRGGEPWYFMEEKYPELGNLMPRDVVSREMYLVVRSKDCGDQVYLDMTGLSPKVWEKKLSDLRAEIRQYLGKDPAHEPIAVEPGIHYFMGGIDVDCAHRTNIDNLYAAGECCSQYHGANRLGGNSMLGAIYGGIVAAEDICAAGKLSAESAPDIGKPEDGEGAETQVRESFSAELRDVLLGGLGIVRTEEQIREALRSLGEMVPQTQDERCRLLLGEAMLMSAAERRESRGAHCRADYPQSDEAQRRRLIASAEGDKVRITAGQILQGGT